MVEHKHVTQESIPSWASGFLALQDLRQIEDAIHKAEEETSAEIVPVVVRNSVNPAIQSKILLLFLLTLFGIFTTVSSLLFSSDVILIEASLLIGFAIYGYKKGWPYRLLAWVLGDAVIDGEVEQRAEIEFYRSRIFKTKEATGILIFISLTEHRVLILVGESLLPRFSPPVLDDYIHEILKGIREQKFGQGMANVICRISESIKNDFPRSPSDSNELANHLQFKED